MSDRLIGVFNRKQGGCCAECADCLTPLFVGKTEDKVKKAVKVHYKAQHPEHTIRFARYHRSN